jgi:glycosyltransferase involved in cell wall biosynthesis
VGLDVFGVSAKDVPRELKRSFVSYRGYQAEIPFAEYDLLIHPAVSEPFGMVVIEALSSGCRALISDKVGAAEKNHDGLVVSELDAPLSRWVDAATALVERVPDQLPRFETWADVAVYYDASVYTGISI